VAIVADQPSPSRPLTVATTRRSPPHKRHHRCTIHTAGKAPLQNALPAFSAGFATRSRGSHLPRLRFFAILSPTPRAALGPPRGLGPVASRWGRGIGFEAARIEAGTWKRVFSNRADNLTKRGNYRYRKALKPHKRKRPRKDTQTNQQRKPAGAKSE